MFALEILDNLLTGEIKQIVLPLLDDLTVAERLEQMSVRVPQKTLTADDRFHDVVDRHFDQAFFWTRSCMLFQIGNSKSQRHLDQVEHGLRDRESVIRETAIWCMGELAPADLRTRIGTFIGDSNAQVSGITKSILASLPAPDPAP